MHSAKPPGPVTPRALRFRQRSARPRTQNQHRLDAVADLVDDACRLMSGDEGEVGEEGAVVDVDVGAADAGDRHRHAHLARPRLGRRHVAHLEGAWSLEEDGLHRLKRFNTVVDATLCPTGRRVNVRKIVP
jgi:hypothetical protein